VSNGEQGQADLVSVTQLSMWKAAADSFVMTPEQESYLHALAFGEQRYIGLDQLGKAGVSAAPTRQQSFDCPIWEHVPFNSHLAPTVIVKDSHKLLNLTLQEQQEIVQNMLNALDEEIYDAQWDTPTVSRCKQRCACLSVRIGRQSSLRVVVRLMHKFRGGS
jgi:hypothetical protein